MALKGCLYLRRLNTCSVVGNLDKLPAVAADIDVNGRSSGVNSILHQFLYYRSWSFYNFAGRYLGRQLFGENLNGHNNLFYHKQPMANEARSGVALSCQVYWPKMTVDWRLSADRSGY